MDLTRFQMDTRDINPTRDTTQSPEVKEYIIDKWKHIILDRLLDRIHEVMRPEIPRGKFGSVQLTNIDGTQSQLNLDPFIDDYFTRSNDNPFLVFARTPRFARHILDQTKQANRWSFWQSKMLKVLNGVVTVMPAISGVIPGLVLLLRRMKVILMENPNAVLRGSISVSRAAQGLETLLNKWYMGNGVLLRWWSEFFDYAQTFSLSELVPQLSLESTMASSLVSMFTMGAVGYTSIQYIRQRMMNSRRAQDLAFDNLSKIAKVIAVKAYNDRRTYITELTVKTAVEELQSLQKQQMETSIRQMTENMARQKQQAMTDDQIRLQTIANQYVNDPSLGISPFEVMVYICLGITRGFVNETAGQVFLSAFGANGRSYGGSAGKLVTYMAEQKSMCDTNPTQAVCTRLRDMQTVVDRLRAVEWDVTRDDEMKQPSFWDRWARLSIGNTSSGLVNQLQLANDVSQDSAYRHRGAPADCIVMDYRLGKFLENKSDMFSEKDDVKQSATIPADDSNFEEARRVFTDMLTRTGWKKDDTLYNSYQTLWLFRWMGPACSRWIMTDTPRDAAKRQRIDTRSLRFVTVECRARFAFLKTMLSESLLFLFVRPKEAESYFDETKTANSYVTNVFKRLQIEERPLGEGYGILVLDNCRPGHVRIVARDKTLVKSASELVKIIVKDTGKWMFRPNEILTAVIQWATENHIFLLSNKVLKKDADPTYSTQDEGSYSTMPFHLSVDTKSRYNMTDAQGNLARLEMKDPETAAKIKESNIAFFPDRGSDVGSIQKLIRFQQGLHQLKPESTAHDPSQSITSLRITSCPAADDKIREYLVKLGIQVDPDVLGIIRYEQKWRDMFGKDLRFVGDVEIVNQLCVNPFGLCVYSSPDQVRRIFGDIWFLQPIILKIKGQFKYKFARFTSLIPMEERTRVYLENMLYLKDWQPFTIKAEI